MPQKNLCIVFNKILNHNILIMYESEYVKIIANSKNYKQFSFVFEIILVIICRLYVSRL